MATTIAQVSVTVNQGGSSNLQRFKAHHPPTFKVGGDSIESDHWFQKVDKILEAAFQLKRESQVWWDWVKASRNLEAMT